MRNRLIQLIHVAKRELKLDEIAYRALLEGATGKASCSAMTDKELEQVLAACERAGFKRLKPKRKYSPRSGNGRSNEADKIRALWIQMGKDGFVRDHSETALNRWCQRTTVVINHGVGVGNVSWLTPDLAWRVLEALKNWHKREMVQAIADRGESPPLNERGHIASYTRVDWAFRRGG
jgi:phage gp16-like protein